MGRPQPSAGSAAKDASDDESLIDAGLIHSEEGTTSFVVEGSISPNLVSPSKTARRC